MRRPIDITRSALTAVKEDLKAAEPAAARLSSQLPMASTGIRPGVRPVTGLRLRLCLQAELPPAETNQPDSPNGAATSPQPSSAPHRTTKPIDSDCDGA
jgi:hypothetical protein